MAVPKKKTSKSRRNMRRSHLALEPINLSINKTSGAYVRPHHINLNDGTYNGKKVIKTKAVS